MKDLKSLLVTDTELSGLLNHAVVGLRRLHSNDDFTVSKTSERALKDYQKQNDPVTAFVDEECILHPDAFIERGLLYTSYIKFCKDNHYKDLSNRSFYKKIRMLDGVNEKREFRGNTRGFTGISIKTVK